MRIFSIDDKPFSWKRLPPGDVIHITKVIVFRTFALDEFLKISNVDRLIFHLSEFRYLYAQIPNSNIEIFIMGRNIPKTPAITLISDEDGDLHWIMHECNIAIDNEIKLFQQGYIPEEVYRKLHRDGHVGIKTNIDKYNDNIRELDDLFFNAFEGDSGAYWNID